MENPIIKLMLNDLSLKKQIKEGTLQYLLNSSPSATLSNECIEVLKGIAEIDSITQTLTKYIS